MSDPKFDPYYKWLGISADDQPANHYRLLGVDQFESDADVIESLLSVRLRMFARLCSVIMQNLLKLNCHPAMGKAALSRLQYSHCLSAFALVQHDPQTRRE
ncbi:MAG: hypothetical protein ACPHJ3_16920 [Rubripirellula sp.]